MSWLLGGMDTRQAAIDCIGTDKTMRRKWRTHKK